ncbi:MAG: PhoH family protein [Bacteroidota bacterium]|nr:PhoH family protein [Bacteroidota bacterium]MDP4273523.1 PhoH family protein [Bacteroidota bacterium]
MIEKIIYLEGIDPVVFYGVNNINFEILKKNFANLKIIGRGNELKVLGTAAEVKYFEKKMEILIGYFHKYNNISEQDLALLIEDTEIDHSKIPPQDDEDEVLVYGNTGRPVKARTPNQKRLVQEYKNNDMIFAIGPAGTGKTYTAIALAVKAFKNKEVKRIILTRPAVEAGEHLGFLPGDMKEKLDPYLQPLYDALHDMMPPKRLATLIEDGTVQIAPLAFMRGRTLDNAFVILDEAQNTTVNQLKMFLTRMGLNAKFIITGDITQIDLPSKESSGLIQATHILKGIEGISFVRFDTSDIVRHRLVRYIVDAYDKYSSNKKKE